MTEEMKKMVLDHVGLQSWPIGFDEVVTYEKLFGQALLESTTSLEHRFILERALSLLTACGEIDLEFAGVNDEGQTLYRRIS